MLRFLPPALRRRLERSEDLRLVGGNAAWHVAERVVTFACALAAVVVLARALGPATFGTYSYAIAFVGLFAQLGTLGLAGVLLRDLVVHGHSGDVLGTAFVLRLGGGALAVLVTGLAVLAFSPGPDVARVLIAVLATAATLNAFDVVERDFHARMETRYAVYAKVFAVGVSTASIVLLAAAGASLLAIVLAKSAESALLAAGLLVLHARRGRRLGRWRFRRDVAVRLLRQSWPLVLSGLGAAVYLRIDQVMLGEMLGAAAVGTYAAAAQLSESWYFVAGALVTSAFPVLLRDRARSEARYRDRLQRLSDVLFGISLSVVVPATLLAPWIVGLVYGPGYGDAGLILAIHVWGGVFMFQRAVLGQWLVTEGLTAFTLWTHGAGAVVNVLLNLWLIPLHGGVGAAVATVVSYAVASYVSLFFHRKTWPAARVITLAFASPVRYAVRAFAPRAPPDGAGG